MADADRRNQWEIREDAISRGVHQTFLELPTLKCLAMEVCAAPLQNEERLRQAEAELLESCREVACHKAPLKGYSIFLIKFAGKFVNFSLFCPKSISAIKHISENFILQNLAKM